MFRPNFLVLAVLALVSSASGAPPENAPPEKGVLLPPPLEFGGVEVEIKAAGFGTPADVSRAENVRGNRTTGFYFSYLARPKNAAISLESAAKAVNLTGVFAPDGAPLRLSARAFPATNDAADGKKNGDATEFYADVLPTWKSVRAEFEVRDLLAPPQDAGRDQTTHRFEAIALPEAGEKTTETTPDVEWKTERGTGAKLVKIEREGKRVRFLWRFEPLAGATKYNVEIQGARLVYDAPDASDFAYSTKQYTDSTEVQIEGLNAPLAAKSATLSFDLVESARGWRKKSAFSLVSFQIPVAKSWEAAPLAIETPPVAPVSARNADFEATWESLGDTLGTWMESHSRLWMRDLTPDSSLGVWTPQSVDFQDGERTRNLFSWALPPEGVFHADNSLRRAGELGYSLRLSASPTTPASADLVVKAQRARTFITPHTLKNVPLPAPNTMRDYEADEFDDGIWKLRRATWIEDDPAFKTKLGFSRNCLVLTFERDPATAFENDQMMRMDSIFYDEKGVLDPNGGTFFDGGPAMEGAEKTHISMVLWPPPRGASHWSGNFTVRQQMWSGPILTLILPNVPINPNLKP